MRSPWLSQNQATRRLVAILIVVALVSAGAGAWLDGDLTGLLIHAGTSLGGAVVAFVLIHQVFAHNEERKLLNCKIMPRLRSRVNAVALTALDDVRQQGWLYDGSLQGTYMSGANLKGANLEEANLQDALLMAANLQDARLRHSNLLGANLWRANLRDAHLEAANLAQANLQGATLLGAQWDDQTILPDGARWRPGTDLARFTDPHHPRAWQGEAEPEPPPVELASLPWFSEDGRGSTQD
jgi:hypothetical protein